MKPETRNPSDGYPSWTSRYVLVCIRGEDVFLTVNDLSVLTTGSFLSPDDNGGGTLTICLTRTLDLINPSFPYSAVRYLGRVS